MGAGIPVRSPGEAPKPNIFERDNLSPGQDVRRDPSGEDDREGVLPVPRDKKVVGISTKTPSERVRQSLLWGEPQVGRLDHIGEDRVPLQFGTPEKFLGVGDEGLRDRHPTAPTVSSELVHVPRFTRVEKAGLAVSRPMPGPPTGSTADGVSADCRPMIYSEAPEAPLALP